MSALRTEEYFAERASRGQVTEALRILKRAGAGKPPPEGDELPKGGVSPRSKRYRSGNAKKWPGLSLRLGHAPSLDSPQTHPHDSHRRHRPGQARSGKILSI